MDMTVNECDVEVNGYPTLMLFPRGKKSSPIEFPGGDREVSLHSNKIGRIGAWSKGLVLVGTYPTPSCV
jgi:hypothetical protein